MGDIYRAFSTPLYRKRLKLDKKVINPILRDIDFYRLPTDDGWASKSPWILEEDLAPIKPMVQECIDDMAFNDWKFEDHYKFEIQNSWVMKHKAGDHSAIHWHSNSLFSGILYLQCDDLSGTLMFVNELNFCNNMFAFDFKEDNPLNQDTIGVVPEDGDMIIFPSKTYHMVTPSRSDYMRFCLAFNVWVHGPLNKTHPHSNSQLDL